MQLRALSFALLVLAACSGPSTVAPQLSGEWAAASATLGGEDYAVENFEGTLCLTADSYEFAGDKGSYQLFAPGDSPVWIDVRGREGPNAGRTILAICKRSGDDLTICYQLGYGERPREFSSPAQSAILLVRYERVVPEEDEQAPPESPEPATPAG
jgi:uncharacterized protein (TIGR03067 family)